MSKWSSLLFKQKTYEITNLLPETEYTVSINGTYSEPIEVWLTTLITDENGIIETEVNQDNAVYVGYLEYNKLTFTTQGLHTALVLRTLGDLDLTAVQLEKGTVVTDWTPAPEEHERRMSIIEQTADGIRVEVSQLEDRVDSNTAQLTVQAGEISSKVNTNGVISAINQTSETIAIDANKINLTGYVTISNLTTEINNTKSYADTQANTAQSNAEAYTDAQVVAIDGVLKTYTDSEISAFSGGLGDLAFKDKVGTALLDNTIIDGGYIRTNLISFNNAVGTNVNLTGTITANSGKVGGFDISSGNLVGDSVSLKPNEITIGYSALQSSSDLGHVLLKGSGLAIGTGENDGYGSWISLERNLNQVSVASYTSASIGVWVRGDRLTPATLGTSSTIGFDGNRFGSIYLVNQPNVASDTRYKSEIQDIDPLLIEIIGREVKPKQYRTQFDDKIHFGYIAQDVERALYKYCGNDKDKYAMLSKDESYMSLLYGEVNVIIEAYHRLQNKKLEERIAVLEKGEY